MVRKNHRLSVSCGLFLGDAIFRPPTGGVRSRIMPLAVTAVLISYTHLHYCPNKPRTQSYNLFMPLLSWSVSYFGNINLICVEYLITLMKISHYFKPEIL
jgi:hypothetical protein